MKKVLIALALVAGTVSFANAEEFAPEKGDFSLEVQFSPFKSDGTSFTTQGINGRYFFSDKDALSFSLNIGGRNVKNVPDTDHDEIFEKGYFGNFSIDLGYQRHFYQYKRIDLYAGGKIGYGHNFAGSTVQTDKDNKIWKNSFTYEGETHNTQNVLRLYATTGIDFYVYKGLYVGAELNLGFEDAFAVKSTTKVTVAGNEVETKSKNGGHDFNGGFNVDPRVRLGWTF